jgi:hypothetical protein
MSVEIISQNVYSYKIDHNNVFEILCLAFPTIVFQKHRPAVCPSRV